MSRARYYFSFTPEWQRTPLAKWLTCVVGAVSMGVSVYFAVHVADNLLTFAVQGFVWGAILQAHGTGLTERYFGRFVDISLGKVSWRLTDPSGALRPRRETVSLARVRVIEVHVLRIDFRMADGQVHSMPLGELPYDVVREVKQRFEGEHSLAGATMGLGAVA